MNQLTKDLLEELAYLQSLQEQMAEQISHAPESTLRISSHRGKIQYYQCFPHQRPRRTYIPQNQTDLIRLLAQKQYDQKVLFYAQSRIPIIHRLIDLYSEENIDNILLSEHPARRQWITPVRLSWEEYLQEWMSQPYEGMKFEEGTTVIKTALNERVRSKSEKIIADTLTRMGVRYKYECPLQISSYRTIYPDFTALSPYTREKIYWEHFGLMGKPEYAADAVRKIEQYEKQHLYPGHRLIMTFETNGNELDSQLVEQLIEQYLIKKD